VIANAIGYRLKHGIIGAKEEEVFENAARGENESRTIRGAQTLG
jgi:hypothetical protein